jgi:SAM-dependent methyltransferase
MAAAAYTRDSIETSVLFGDVIARAASYSPERVAAGAIELLAPRPTDAVLELGCGSGRLLAQVAARVQRGFAAGVDPSPLMVRHARFRNRRFIERGFLDVAAGASDDLSRFGGARFDAVLGLHVVCFWTTPAHDLAEIRRVLRPGGRLVLGFSPREPGDAADRARCVPAQVEEWLRAAGFDATLGRCDRDANRSLAWLRAIC